jgi:hypothetical protein
MRIIKNPNTTTADQPSIPAHITDRKLLQFVQRIDSRKYEAEARAVELAIRERMERGEWLKRAA